MDASSRWMRHRRGDCDGCVITATVMTRVIAEAIATGASSQLRSRLIRHNDFDRVDVSSQLRSRLMRYICDRDGCIITSYDCDGCVIAEAIVTDAPSQRRSQWMRHHSYDCVMDASSQRRLRHHRSNRDGCVITEVIATDVSSQLLSRLMRYHNFGRDRCVITAAIATDASSERR